MIAGSDLAQYVRVKLTGPNTVGVAAAADKAIGITQAPAKEGNPVTIRPIKDAGIHLQKIVTAAALNATDELEAGAGGALVPKDSGAAVAVVVDDIAADAEVNVTAAVIYY